MRHALKSLLQTPKTTFVVVSTLALAVALVTTVFSALNAYAWRALPYPDPSRIVAIGVEQTPYAGRLGSVHRQDLLRIREMEDAFTRVAAYTLLHPSLRGDGPAYRAPVVAADGDLLPLLGAVPARGRVLVDDDENVVVLSHTGWVRRFGGRADVIGGTLHVEGRPHVVIGVLEERFGFENAEAFVPLRSTGEAAHVSVLARLAGGVSPGQAASRLRSSTLSGEYDGATGLGLSTDMIQRDSILRAGALPWLFLGATLLVLLAACANVISILMARAVGRESQNAVRLALGASGRRLALASIAESFLMAAAASALGLILCVWLLRSLPALLPGDLPSWIRLEIDARVLAVTAALGLLTTTVVGLLPARHASVPDLQLLMKGGGAGGRTLRQARLTRRLVVLEIAVSVALFISTLLLVRSHGQATRFDPGFPARQVLAMDVHLSPETVGRGWQADAWLTEAVRRLTGLAAANGVSWSGDAAALRDDSDVADGGRVRVARPDGERLPIDLRMQAVGPAYFETIGTPVVRGRGFGPGDVAGMPLVVIVSREFARRTWPDTDGDAVGRRLVIDTAGGSRTGTVIGIVEDQYAIYGNRAGTSVRAVPLVYLSAAQAVSSRYTLVARTERPESLLGPALAALRGLHADVPVENAGTLWERMRIGFAERIFAILFGAIGAAALLLAVIGLYGVVSYSVQQRTREFGVRMALGASPLRVAREVVGGGLGMTLAGLAAGALLAFGMAQLLRMLLFGVGTLDPVAYIAVALLFTAVSLLAGYLPGRRAMRVDPAEALRAE